MSLFNKFNISLSGNLWLLLLGFILILFYTIFIYRVTLPSINKYYKFLLIGLRTIALSAILLLLFEPILNIIQKIKIEPTNLIFIDNSKSISEFSNQKNITEIKNIAKQISKNVNGINKIFSFGKEVNEISVEEIDSLKFDESSTNLNSIFSYINKFPNVSSIAIISDGIINEGKNPQTEIDKLNIPIYTVIVGDTTTSNDIAVISILSNEFIYPNKETEIEATITNIGFAEKNVNVKLLENNKTIANKNLILSSTGINRITFPYSSRLSGEHKLKVIVTSSEKEDNKRNNTKTTVINILTTKKKILLLSGSPSSDLSAIRNSLSKNNDLEIESIIQINSNKFYKNQNKFDKINTADVLILINFPSSDTHNDFIIKVKDTIKKSDKPFLLCFSNNTDFSKLKLLGEVLPFNFSTGTNLFLKTQAEVVTLTNNLLGNTEQLKEEWNKLPPIEIAAAITTDVSSEILLQSKTNNKLPIVFTNKISNKKSIIINATNIWKWKLQATHKEYKLFDNFILNSIKWLSSNNDNARFKLKPIKKNFKLGETIVFIASLYDETFNPINNANIIIETTHNNQSQIFNFSSLGDGIYESKIELNKPGFYNYSGKLLSNKKVLKSIRGKFNIEKIELELVNSKADKNLLLTLSKLTAGKIYNLVNSKKLIKLLNKNYKSNIIYKYQDNKLHLSSLDFILIIIVLILSIEWIIRKILRML